MSSEASRDEIVSTFNLDQHYGPREIDCLFAAITAWNTRLASASAPAGLSREKVAGVLAGACPKLWGQSFEDAVDAILSLTAAPQPPACDERSVQKSRAGRNQPPVVEDAEGILEALDEAIKQYAEPMSPLNGHELGERLANDVGEIVRHARARAARTAQPAEEWMREALTPSGDTKAAYLGEFKFDVMFPSLDEDDDEPVPHPVTVPWDTIKEIMAAIAARAALKEPRDDR